MKTECVAKVVVLNTAGEVLLLRRSQSDPRRAGEWDFPGGGLESGEDFAKAAARELFEEAHIEVAVDQLQLLYTGTMFYESKATNVHRMLYLAKIDDDQMNSIALSFEHDQSVWRSVEQALHDFPHPFYSVGLRHAHEHGLLD